MDNRSTSLLLGEGNFSFAAAISEDSGIGSASRLIATDLNKTFLEDSNKTLKETAKRKQETIKKNISTVEKHSGIVFLDVDATKIEQHEGLQKYRDDIKEITFNFPHVQRKKMQIGLNRELLKGFFNSVKEFLSKKSSSNKMKRVQVIVTLCKGQSGIDEVEVDEKRKYEDSWMLLEMAASGSFILTKVETFKEFFARMRRHGENESYESVGYKNGLSGFNTEGAHTFTFILRKPPSLPFVPEGVIPGKTQITTPRGEPLILDKYFNLEENLEFLRSELKWKLEYVANSKKSERHPLIALLKTLDISMKALDIEFQFEESPPSIQLWVKDLDASDVINMKNKFQSSQMRFSLTKNSNLRYNLNISKLLTGIDGRLIFSKYWKFTNPILKHLENEPCTTGSLYPLSYKLDISFWTHYQCCIPSQNSTFLKDVNITALLVFGLLLEDIKLMDTYFFTKGQTRANCNLPQTKCSICTNELPRVSYCFRVILKSLDLPLSKDTAKSFMRLFDRALMLFLSVEIR